MYILILLYPLFSAIASGFFGRYFGRQGSAFLSLSLIFFSVLFSFFAFFEVNLSSSQVVVPLYTWINIQAYEISFGLLFDSLTCFMLLIITGISFLVHLYSLGYMSEDPHLSRFIAYLSLFTFFMIFLVTADNFLQMFIGWEGVGICSYLLINFWHTRYAANKAALKAMIMNRIADVFFIFALILILLEFKTLNYQVVFSLIPFLVGDSFMIMNWMVLKVDFIAFFLLFGAIGKSAQLGLHTWLPDAMEGPTPVSSLLHAATMVTAGVFLLIRCSFILELSPNVLSITALLGAFTAFFSAVTATFQFDIKKVIAYSTCSQLGYMVLACGLSNYHIALFHLFLHAFFKALLFLSAGSVIHAIADEQDMRRMGSLASFLPFTYVCMSVGSFAIMGFPFLTGFYSKDLLIELTFVRYMVDGLFIHALASMAAFFTSVYSFRLILFVFFFKTNLYKSYLNIHEASNQMAISMFILCLASIFCGYLFSDLATGYGTPVWNGAIFVSFNHYNFVEAHFLHPFIKNLPLILSVIGALCVFIYTEFVHMRQLMAQQSRKRTLPISLEAYPLDISVPRIFLKVILMAAKESYYIWRFIILSLWRRISSFFYHAGLFNSLYNSLLIVLFGYSYEFINKTSDKGFWEYLGPYGLYKLFRSSSYSLRNFPDQVIFFFLGFMFYAIVLILFYIFVFFFLNSSSLILVAFLLASTLVNFLF